MTEVALVLGMSNFRDSSWYRREQRQKSRKKIIDAFLESKYQGKKGEEYKRVGAARYKHLKIITKLSHSVLSQRLEELVREGLVRKAPSAVERDYYVLTTKAVKDVLVYAYMFAEQSSRLVEETEHYQSVDDLISDFSRKLGALAIYVMIKSLTMGLTVRAKKEILPVSPAKEWLNTAIDFWHLTFAFGDKLKTLVTKHEPRTELLKTSMNIGYFTLKDTDHFYKVLMNSFERLHPLESEKIIEIEETVKEIISIK